MTIETLEALSVIATLLGALGSILGAANLYVNINKSKKNNANRNKIRNSNVNIGDKYYSGATVDQVEKSINERMKYEKEPYGVSLDRLKELAPKLEKDKRYFIPVVWAGLKVEYEQLVANGEVLKDVIYIITDEDW